MVQIHVPFCDFVFIHHSAKVGIYFLPCFLILSFLFDSFVFSFECCVKNVIFSGFTGASWFEAQMCSPIFDKLFTVKCSQY